MPGDDEDGDTSSIYESALETLSLGQSVDVAASDIEGPGGDHSADMDATPPPPLGIKLTGYRLVFMTTILSVGTAKTIISYKGQSVAPTTLDWASGTALTAMLYWVGLYEESNKWKWFFQVDFAPAIGHFAKCLGGGVMWLLFYLDSVLVFVLLHWMLCSLTGRLFHRHLCVASLARIQSLCMCNCFLR
ncbi:hypothetical protein EI94DRAFT_890007 [Lactarius quietus]|nr:hypothetical protein EI94DRAFT_890007 [Lactarius quietus]